MEVVFGAIASLFGYIDPGTGSLIFQVLAASLISAGLFFKGLRQRVVWLTAKVFRWRRVGQALHEAVDHNDAVAGQVKQAQPEPQRKAA